MQYLVPAPGTRQNIGTRAGVIPPALPPTPSPVRQLMGIVSKDSRHNEQRHWAL